MFDRRADEERIALRAVLVRRHKLGVFVMLVQPRARSILHIDQCVDREGRAHYLHASFYCCLDLILMHGKILLLHGRVELVRCRARRLDLVRIEVRPDRRRIADEYHSHEFSALLVVQVTHLDSGVDVNDL